MPLKPSLRKRLKRLEAWGGKLDIMFQMIIQTTGVVRGLVALNAVLMDKGIITKKELEDARERLSKPSGEDVDSEGSESVDNPVCAGPVGGERGDSGEAEEDTPSTTTSVGPGIVDIDGEGAGGCPVLSSEISDTIGVRSERGDDNEPGQAS